MGWGAVEGRGRVENSMPMRFAMMALNVGTLLS